ncbi:MAG: hypothetical protein KGJ90_02095 [Patescibacteria group bacterium]|nr:hypothetical protein [Patescibacteria group bacterium]
MALQYNTTAAPGLLNLPSQSFGTPVTQQAATPIPKLGTIAPTSQNAFGSTWKPTAGINFGAYSPATIQGSGATSLGGLIPVHAPVGSVPGATSHTFTTDPSGKQTTTVKFATPQQSSADANSSSVLPNYDPQGNAIVPPPGSAPAGTPIPDFQPSPSVTSTPPSPASFPGIIGGLAAGAGKTLQTGQQEQGQAYKMAQMYQQKLEAQQEQAAQALGDIGSSPIPIEFQQGRAAVVQGQELAAQNAIASALAGESNLATIGSGLQSTGLSALGTAAGQVQPSPAGYGQAVFNPLTGQYETGTGGTMGGATGGTTSYDPQTLASQLAPLVASGQMSIDAANSQMTGGVAGQNILRQAILGINPKFNFNLSSSSATTQAQGQQLQTQSNTVNQALDTLQSYFAQLSPLQTQGIPLTNDITQTLGQFFGSGKVSQFNNALNDARVQVQNILGTVGVTPTESGLIANQYLPAGMTPQQLQSNIGSLKTLIGQKVQNFIASGQQQPTSQSQTGSGTVQTSAGVINTNW